MLLYMTVQSFALSHLVHALTYNYSNMLVFLKMMNIFQNHFSFIHYCFLGPPMLWMKTYSCSSIFYSANYFFDLDD